MTEVILRDIKIGENGEVHTHWDDQEIISFRSLAAIQETLREIDQDKGKAKLLCLAYVLARSNGFVNLSSGQNKRFIFDLTHSSPIRMLD